MCQGYRARPRARLQGKCAGFVDVPRASIPYKALTDSVPWTYPKRSLLTLRTRGSAPSRNVPVLGFAVRWIIRNFGWDYLLVLPAGFAVVFMLWNLSKQINKR